VFFDGRAAYTTDATSTAGQAIWSLQDANVAYDAWKRLDQYFPGAGPKSNVWVIHTSRSFPVVGGVAYDFRLIASKFNSADAFVIDNMQMRVELT
jgi:hypothetical protein